MTFTNEAAYDAGGAQKNILTSLKKPANAMVRKLRLQPGKLKVNGVNEERNICPLNA